MFYVNRSLFNFKRIFLFHLLTPIGKIALQGGKNLVRKSTSNFCRWEVILLIHCFYCSSAWVVLFLILLYHKQCSAFTLPRTCQYFNSL